MQLERQAMLLQQSDNGTAIEGDIVIDGATGTDTEAAELDRVVQKYVSIIVPIMFGLIGFVGLIGNSLVVAVVAFNTSMRSTTNILIINLAVADLLFVMFCIPFTGTDFVLPYWPFGNVWCKCVQYLIIVTACASVYTLVLMSFDRYLAVVHPVSSRAVRTEGHAIVAICIVWFIILTVSIPVFMIHGEVSEAYSQPELSEARNGTLLSDSGRVVAPTPTRPARINSSNSVAPLELKLITACRILDERDWPVFQWIFFLASYLVPLLLIGGLYLGMLMRLWQAPRISADGLRGRKRVTRLVAVVVGVFAFSWAPIQIVLVCKSLEVYPHNTATIWFQIFGHVLAYANSCVNPILYAFLSENFRKAFWKAMYCRDTTNQDQHNHLQTRTTRIPSSGQII
ncbi:allatostatin-A receptor-like isoform X1 [Copidosoma floridanum]|uniref:allatostatin-A receptor-like isoform X1 n=1 Tax=Copidosoma floridanum TaxID=29053 RepID=UPI0006C99914|nr:allatostatin-A receptor-like isoform X1 [Copidosoma floridanum]